MRIDSIILYRVLDGDNILYSNWNATDVVQWAINHSPSGNAIGVGCTLPLTSGTIVRGGNSYVEIRSNSQRKKKSKRKGKFIGGEEIIQE